MDLYGLQGGTAASPSSSPWAAGKFLLQHLKHLFAFLLHWPWDLQSSLAHLSLAAVAQLGFFCFLNTLTPQMVQWLCVFHTVCAKLPRACSWRLFRKSLVSVPMTFYKGVCCTAFRDLPGIAESQLQVAIVGQLKCRLGLWMPSEATGTVDMPWQPLRSFKCKL